MKTKIFNALRTKASSFGFNRDELMSVAEQIANNQTLNDDSTDEEINAVIEAVIPILKVGQQYAGRIANTKQPTDTTSNGGGTPPVIDVNPNANDAEPAWFKAFREASERRLEAIERKDTLAARKTRLSEVLKDAGNFAKSTLKAYERMSFKDDADFDEWLSEIETEVADYRQDESNSELGKNAKPNAPQKPDGANPKVASDAQIEALVSRM